MFKMYAIFKFNDKLIRIFSVEMQDQNDKSSYTVLIPSHPT